MPGGEPHPLRHKDSGQPEPPKGDRPLAHQASRQASQETKGLLPRLQLPIGIMQQTEEGDCQGRVVSGRAIPQGRLHRHQHERQGQERGEVLQRERQLRAVDKGVQVRFVLDEALLHAVFLQPGEARAVRHFP